MSKVYHLLFTAAASVLFLIAPATAQGAAACAAIGTSDLSAVRDAPGQIQRSEIVPAAGALPEVCRVRGTALSNTSFAMSLPTSGWNGKFLQAGCAGFCGRTMVWACDDAIRRGYACIVNDMGHRSAPESRVAPSLSAFWAYQNDTAQIDHGFRAVHTTALIGKAVVNGFYGRGPEKSYFNGCSEGGREGLIAAQRFPYDFDGIIAGAPLIDVGRTFQSTLWNARAMRDKAGRPVLSPATASRIQSAVLSRCDLNDGLADGVIGDPRLCDFDPRSLVCAAAGDTACISPAEAATVLKIIDGPTTSSGVALSRGGLSPAISWMRLLAPGSEGRSVPASYGEEFFRYMGFWPAPGPTWSADTFDFDRDFMRTGIADALMSATNPDLRTFRAQGGKLLLYHGWDDHLISPSLTVDYYETVRSTMGGQASTDPFMRLFMAPGMDHCALGNGAWAIDFLSYLERWVEHGEAPQSILAIRPKLPADPAKALARIGVFPVPPEEVDYKRRLFSFPLQARYRGRGDPAEADSYELTQ